MLIDSFGRKIEYLRIGVTDRCNLRCRYCMPEEGINFAPKDSLLSYEEIERLCKIFSSLGVSKARITGGEPFVRKDLMHLIRKIRPLFPFLHITSNATLIHNYLDELKELDINGLNISIDSLQPEVFYKITGRNLFHKVYHNISAAIESGFNVKLNIVVLKEINDNEILDFIELTKDQPVDIRFIEAMPFNAHDGNKGKLISFREVIKLIKSSYKIIEIQNPDPSSSVSYKIHDHAGKVSVIPAYSRSLCGSCNRIRITATGKLLNCLYSNSGLDLRQVLRTGADDRFIEEQIKNHILRKKENGFKAESERNSKDAFESMTTIGG